MLGRITLLQDQAELFCAHSLAEARELLTGHATDIDLAILDIGLPDGSGLNLLPELRRPDSTPLQVIVFSPHEVSNEVSKSVALALVKSRASNQDLLDAINALLESTRTGAAHYSERATRRIRSAVNRNSD